MKKTQEIDNFVFIVSLEKLRRENEFEFSLICSNVGLNELTKTLNIVETKKASFIGTLKLRSNNEVFLKGIVTAKLVQACSVTLDPIITHVTKNVFRTFYCKPKIKTQMRKSIFELTEKSFDHDTVLIKLI